MGWQVWDISLIKLKVLFNPLFKTILYSVSWSGKLWIYVDNRDFYQLGLIVFIDYITFLALWFVSLVVHWQVTISTGHSSWTWTMQTDNWLLGRQIYSVKKCSLLAVVVIRWGFSFLNTCSVPYFAQNLCVRCNPRAPCACTCHIPMFVLCIVYILCLCHFVNLSVYLFVCTPR